MPAPLTLSRAERRPGTMYETLSSLNFLPPPVRGAPNRASAAVLAPRTSSSEPTSSAGIGIASSKSHTLEGAAETGTERVWAGSKD
jgi:hypothetical protein